MQFEPMPFKKGVRNFNRLSKYPEIVKIMSDEYAKCVNKDPVEVYTLMWQYTNEFRTKIRRKNRLKNKLKKDATGTMLCKTKQA